MMTTNTMSVAVNNDAELVNGTLEGNRDAFGQIVSRYQSLICSLAYSATGSLGQSEDLAQETFITAWKHLGHLRERDKLRSWLCGIARNRINSFLRREGREPIRSAESLENVSETHSAEPLPPDQTISNEEQAILWRSLERIPELYREPLVLFYREHQSVEAVAQNLDLTEDTVKQRLSRGRKLLSEQVLAFVEGALERTNPGKAFTIGVLAALPATLATSAKAATLAAAAAKGGAAAKTAGIMGFIGVILSPLMILFGNYIPYRLGLAEARTVEERRHIKSFYRKIWTITFGLFACLTILMLCNRRSLGNQSWPELLSHLFCGLVVIYLLTIFISVAVMLRNRKKYLTRILAKEHGGVFPKPIWEYRSPINFLGLPLVHIRLGDRFDMLRKPVKAWIAVSNFAVGGLIAFGGVAVAPLSIGGMAVGIVPIGGFTAGIAVLGGIGLGVWAHGGLIFGWQALGGCAIAWNAAVGGFAWAHDFALGGIAHAAEANNDIAYQIINAKIFFRVLRVVDRYWFLVNLTWILPLLLQWRVIASKRRHELANSES